MGEAKRRARVAYEGVDEEIAAITSSDRAIHYRGLNPAGLRGLMGFMWSAGEVSSYGGAEGLRAVVGAYEAGFIALTKVGQGMFTLRLTMPEFEAQTRPVRGFASPEDGGRVTAELLPPDETIWNGAIIAKTLRAELIRIRNDPGRAALYTHADDKLLVEHLAAMWQVGTTLSRGGVTGLRTALAAWEAGFIAPLVHAQGVVGAVFTLPEKEAEGRPVAGFALPVISGA